MRSALSAAAQRRAVRSRSGSLSAVPPATSSNDYIPELAAVAASILYRSPFPSNEGRPVYILNAAAFPDAMEVDYDSLLAYVLARLPGEDELLSGTEYEIVFFAGGAPETATSEKKMGPSMGWYLQAYHVLGRALRKKLQKLYIVHPRTWVRVLIGVFGTVVSPKFRRKIVHVNTLSQLALHLALEKLLIPPSVYLHDRKLSPTIDVPYASGRRVFGARHPLPRNLNTGKPRLPRVLRETTSFILLPQNIGTEGLFRIPPNNVLAGVLREAYDRGQQYIVWKDASATFVQPGGDPALIDEVRPDDAYSVHLAASLIKTWYRELREPIFLESSYEHLRQRYQSPDADVTPEDLVDLIFPASHTSPLTTTSREILTRHLLPLLSAVAAHEPQNKMTAENLAICFSMCLVCGSDQLEDAKVSSVIRRILQAATEMWPLLRDGLGIDAHAFKRDIQPPTDFRDYEDPVEEENHGPPSDGNAADIHIGHRIVLDDAEDRSPPQKAPHLPPRPHPRATAAAKHLAGLATTVNPALPRRPRANSGAKQISPDDTTTALPLPARPQHASPSEPASASATSAWSHVDSAANKLAGHGFSSPVKRKPAPAVIDTGSAVIEKSPVESPPRYSTVFDTDGRSIHVADSPVDYTPANGFGPRSYGEDMKGFPMVPAPTDPHPALNVPKRKAVHSDAKDDTPAVTDAGTARSASDDLTLARMAAKKATEGLAQRIGVQQLNGADNAVAVQSPDSVSPESQDVFRKPSWPASAVKPQPNIQSLARPVLPLRKSQTVPIITTADADRGPVAPTFPKPRAPSPGLLKRMSSIDPSNNASTTSPSLAPKRLDLKRASVDDLRRLYEERVNTAESLKVAVAARRGSSSHGSESVS